MSRNTHTPRVHNIIIHHTTSIQRPTKMIAVARLTGSRVASRTRPTALVGARSYHEAIIDHYESPRNVGSLDKKDEDVGTGECFVRACFLTPSPPQLRAGSPTSEGRLACAVVLCNSLLCLCPPTSPPSLSPLLPPPQRRPGRRSRLR